MLGGVWAANVVPDGLLGSGRKQKTLQPELGDVDRQLFCYHGTNGVRQNAENCSASARRRGPPRFFVLRYE